jgi:hypothetical protein
MRRPNGIPRYPNTAVQLNASSASNTTEPSAVGFGRRDPAAPDLQLGRRIGINQRTSTIPENDFSRRSDEPAGIVAVPTTAINRPV